MIGRENLPSATSASAGARSQCTGAWSIAYFLPSERPPKRLLKRATWPPVSSIWPRPPVHAGCDRRIDVELQRVAFLAPRRAGLEGRTVGHLHGDGVVVGVGIVFHRLISLKWRWFPTSRGNVGRTYGRGLRLTRPGRRSSHVPGSRSGGYGRGRRRKPVRSRRCARNCIHLAVEVRHLPWSVVRFSGRDQPWGVGALASSATTLFVEGGSDC